MRLSWKSLTLMSVAALTLLAGGGWGYLHDASAASAALRPPSGATFSCQIFRNPFIRFNAFSSKGPLVAASTEGVIGVVVGKTFVNCEGREVTEFKVEDTKTEGTVEGVGDLTITWDKDREVPVSTLTANQRELSFPATQVVRFNPVFILNGEVYRTAADASPASLVNTNVQSFPPPSGTDYVLASALDLTSDSGTSITIPAGRVVTIK